jgi:FkbM family methyltransferase
MDNIDLILDTIHSKITLKPGGNMKSEYSEQRLAVEFLTPESKVLELGSNIGINSIIISNILSNDTNLVTLECDLTHIDTLRYNRDINNLHFNIEASALSSIPLGRRGWHTFPMTPNETNLIPVNTITYEQLLSKYGVHFDTIVADCEGALYYILKDMPYILANIKLIIVENDYIQLDHKLFVDNVLASYNFKLIKSVPGGFDNSPCYNCFYQVFAK